MSIAVRWLTVKQTATILGVSLWVVRRLCREKLLPCRPGPPWEIDAEELKAMLKAGWRHGS